MSEEVNVDRVTDVIGEVCVEGIAGGVDCAAVKINYLSGILITRRRRRVDVTL